MEREEDVATFYQAHKDSSEVWEELDEAPAPPRASRTGLSVSIAVRFSPREAEAIRRTARQMGETYSEVVRKAVHAYTHPEHVLRTNRENVLPTFEATTPRTVSNAPQTSRELEIQPLGTQTRSSAAELTTR